MRFGEVSGAACLGQVSVSMEAWQRVLQGDQGLIEGGLDKQPSQSAQDTGAQEDENTHTHTHTHTHTPRTKQPISRGFLSI